MKLKSKWSFILSFFSLLALACYCLLAWLFMHRYDLLFDEGVIIRSNLCGRMNDGFGIMLILFAPLVTLPSFVVACILGKARSGSQSSHLRSRLFSCLVILVFITTALTSFLYEENRERHNPPRLEQMEMGENPIQAQKQA